MRYQIKTYFKKEELPPLSDVKFFHYASSFDWYKDISYYKPMMFVAFDGERLVAALFALVLRINRLFYGAFFKRCKISQQPAFFDAEANKIEVFDALITAVVKQLESKVFYIEYRNIGDAIFGYKGFRENHFYSVKWINVKNSLQRKRNIWNQLAKSRRNQVSKAKRKGVTIEEITSPDRLVALRELIEKNRNRKISRRFPPYQSVENFFYCYVKEGKGKILVATQNGKIIGGIILGFEGKTVYSLYYWGKDKTHKMLYPSVFVIYSAMEMAEKQGFDYFDFMDAGYLNEKAGQPRFLLQFGGKPQASRRWYRINWKWLNFFANKIYN